MSDTPSPNPQPDVPNPVYPDPGPVGIPGSDEPLGVPPTTPSDVPSPAEPVGIPPSGPQEIPIGPMGN